MRARGDTGHNVLAFWTRNTRRGGEHARAVERALAILRAELAPAIAALREQLDGLADDVDDLSRRVDDVHTHALRTVTDLLDERNKTR